MSVVTTVYNGVPYFDRAIPGILEQTFDDFEFVVVDDGSSDRTPDRLREVASRDPRVRIFSPGRLGAAGAYNYGVAQARG
ncbi:MAG: glycosyltransferase family 2 protein, partial [Actinomycetota bacterium]